MIYQTALVGEVAPTYHNAYLTRAGLTRTHKFPEGGSCDTTGPQATGRLPRLVLNYLREGSRVTPAPEHSDTTHTANTKTHYDSYLKFNSTIMNLRGLINYSLMVNQNIICQACPGCDKCTNLNPCATLMPEAGGNMDHTQQLPSGSRLNLPSCLVQRWPLLPRHSPEWPNSEGEDDTTRRPGGVHVPYRKSKDCERRSASEKKTPYLGS